MELLDILPSQGHIYIDSSALIYSVEQAAPYYKLLRPLWEKAGAQEITIVTSALTVTEALVKPMRDRNQEVVQQYDEVFSSDEITLLQPDTRTFRLAGEIRATLNLKTADAIHAATALQHQCTAFVTNDTDFNKVPQINPIILKDLI